MHLFEQLKSEMDEDKRADLIFPDAADLVDDAAVLIDGYYNLIYDPFQECRKCTYPYGRLLLADHRDHPAE